MSHQKLGAQTTSSPKTAGSECKRCPIQMAISCPGHCCSPVVRNCASSTPSRFQINARCRGTGSCRPSPGVGGLDQYQSDCPKFATAATNTTESATARLGSSLTPWSPHWVAHGENARPDSDRKQYCCPVPAEEGCSLPGKEDCGDDANGNPHSKCEGYTSYGKPSAHGS